MKGVLVRPLVSLFTAQLERFGLVSLQWDEKLPFCNYPHCIWSYAKKVSSLFCYPFKLKKRELIFPPNLQFCEGNNDYFLQLRHSGVRYPKVYFSALPKTVCFSSSNNAVWAFGKVTIFGSLALLLFLYNKVILLLWAWGNGRDTHMELQ